MTAFQEIQRLHSGTPETIFCFFSRFLSSSGVYLIWSFDLFVIYSHLQFRFLFIVAYKTQNGMKYRLLRDFQTSPYGAYPEA
ncbi:MAG: hypothetical protein BRC49_04345 [Cyanobacteria bacterium SW_10_48_33]|nr:MAG: hypothetical protein BRC49_04345 [Cyanobacteria bacterium SW_10_48_33]